MRGRFSAALLRIVEASLAEKRAALAALDRLQQKSAKNAAQLGVSEADIDQELQN